MTWLKTILLFLLTIFINIEVVSAQEYILKGKVVNKDKLPVEFLRATLFLNDTSLNETMTDSLGTFFFKMASGNYKLVLEQFGSEFLKRDIELTEDIDLGDMQIDESIILEGVVISRTGSLIKNEGDKLLFDVENSPLSKGYNGLEILRRSPKLQFSNDGTIQLKKKAAEILINGRRVDMSQADLINYLSSLNSEDIKRVEIQDLSSSDVDASNSGGVINIQLKKGIYGFRGILESGYNHYDSGFNKVIGKGNFTYGRDNWNAYLISGADENKTKGNYQNQFDYFKVSRIQKQEGIFHQNNKSYNLRTGIVIYPNNNSEAGAEVYVRGSRDGFSENQSLKIYEAALLTDGKTSSVTNDKTNIGYFTMNYKYKLDTLGSFIRFIGDHGSNKLSRSNIGDISYSLGEIQHSSFLFDTDASSRYYTVQVDWQQKLKSSWQIISGLKFNRVHRINELKSYEMDNQNWQLTQDVNEDFTNKENIFAAYTSVEKNLNKNNYLKVGLRGEHTSTDGVNLLNNEKVRLKYFDLFPSLYYKYSIEQQFLSLSYRRSIYRPSFRDLNPFVIKQSDFLYQKGNPNLKPQYNHRIDLTYGVNKNEFSLFTRFSNELIQTVYYVQGNINYVQPLNFGKENTSGLDHTYSANITKWLYANVSSGIYYYHFQSAELEDSRPTFYNYLYLQAKLPRKILIEIFSNYDYKSQYRNTLAAYQYGLDFSVQKRLLNDNIIAKISATDVLNNRRYKNLSTYSDFDFDFYQKRLTRIVTFSIQYTFKNKGKIRDTNVESDNQSRGRL